VMHACHPSNIKKHWIGGLWFRLQSCLQNNQSKKDWKHCSSGRLLALQLMPLNSYVGIAALLQSLCNFSMSSLWIIWLQVGLFRYYESWVSFCCPGYWQDFDCLLA
jgi:hypothetical protein